MKSLLIGRVLGCLAFQQIRHKLFGLGFVFFLDQGLKRNVNRGILEDHHTEFLVENLPTMGQWILGEPILQLTNDLPPNGMAAGPGLPGNRQKRLFFEDIIKPLAILQILLDHRDMAWLNILHSGPFHVAQITSVVYRSP